MSEPVDAARILVIDDDRALLAAIKRMLAASYRVTVLDTARAASALIESGERFDLILTDTTPRQQTGVELHHELHRIAPDQARRMMFMSAGYRGEPLPPGYRVLAKPFTAKELLLTVMELLREWGTTSVTA